MGVNIMGEAKRRRAQIAELKTFRADEFAKMGCMCAREGCTATYAMTSDGQPPPGWRILYTMKRYAFGKLPNGEPVLRFYAEGSGDRGPGLERDTVLCPHHARELDQEFLKPLLHALQAPAQGNA